MRRELESAFRRTCYRVDMDGGGMVLRVDRHEPALVALLRAAGAPCAALLTAFNPDGKHRSRFRNRQSQRQLRRELARHGHVLIAGRNEDPRGLWPVEESLLALQLPLDGARLFAARYGQLAFLWMEADGRPRLIETAALPG